MAVTSVYELFEGRSGVDTFTRQRTYTRTFEVLTDDDDDGPAVAGGNVLLPRLGDSHPEDSQAVVVAVRPSQDGAEPRRWVVSIDYDTQPELPEALQPSGGAEQDVADVPDSPLDRRPVWKFSFQQTTEVATKGYPVSPLGVGLVEEAIQTSAGMPFDPPVTIEVSRPVVTVTIQVPDLSPSYLLDVQDATNNAPWKGIPERCAKCVGVEAGSGFENGVFFWTITYTFAIKWDTWDIRVLDAGYHQLVHNSQANPTDYVAGIVDPNGHNDGPWPLDGMGHKALPGADPVFLRYVVFRQADFATLFPF